MVDDYWEAKTDTMSPSHLGVSSEEIEAENSKLVNTIVLSAERILDEASSKQSGSNVLEVGVGRGDLTVHLLSKANEKLYNYFGIDSYPKMLEVTRNRLQEIGVSNEFIRNIVFGEAANLTRHRKVPFESDSFRLVIWGKLGEHLVKDSDAENSEWKQALDEVKKVLAPGGYFLLYEPLQDFNEQYQKQPRKHEKTLIRARGEYEDTLVPMTLIESRQWQFFDETYTIALWQKPD